MSICGSYNKSRNLQNQFLKRNRPMCHSFIRLRFVQKKRKEKEIYWPVVTNQNRSLFENNSRS